MPQTIPLGRGASRITHGFLIKAVATNGTSETASIIASSVFQYSNVHYFNIPTSRTSNFESGATP